MGDVRIPGAGRRKIVRTGHVIQQFILSSEHRGGPDNGRPLECSLDTFLPLGLALVEFARRVLRRIKMRQVHESRHTRLRSDACYTLGAVGVYGGVREVPGGDQIFHERRKQEQRERG